MFNINNDKWNIKIVDAYDKHLKRTNGSYSVGCTDKLEKTIYLSNLIHGNFLKKVLRHELVHAYIISNNIYISIKDEEKICDLVATYGEQIIALSELLYKTLLDTESFER